MNRKTLVGILAALAVSAGSLTAQIVTYTQDFETLALAQNPDGNTALSDDGWLVGSNVFDSGGGFIYNYFAFPAPNVGTHFSAVVSGEGGVDQGTQQLSIFNDYNNADHTNNPTWLIESIVFREVTVTADNVGQTWRFEFDAKLGNLAAPTTANAFIKTLDPGAGFAMTNFITQDTTAIPSTWDTYSVDLAIDAGLVGQIFQIGFSSTASGGNPSGVFYDNVSLTTVPEPATIALLSGFAALGLVMYRRRKAASK